MKLLSVAVPCYNVEQYLHKCLDSFQDDRLKDTLEVLIVDDGSKDKTAEIAREYVQRAPELFKLISKENGGHGSAVNAGIDNATGKYFRIVDGDDWVETDHLVELMDILQSTEADMVVDQKTKVDMTTGNETFIKLPDSIEFGRLYDFLEVSGDDICHFYALHTVSTKLELLKSNHVHLLEKAFYVDNEYLLKVAAHSKQVLFVDLDVYRYLVGNVNQSVSHGNYAKRYDQHERVIKECLRFSEQDGWSDGLHAYMRRRIMPLIRTHHIISLIYMTDRAAGKQKAAAFMQFLQETYPSYAKATAGRYRQAKVLHALGFKDSQLNKLKKLVGMK